MLSEKIPTPFYIEEFRNFSFNVICNVIRLLIFYEKRNIVA